MSDDIAVIYAFEEPAPSLSAVFLSARSPGQVETYLTAGWRVSQSPGYRGADLDGLNDSGIPVADMTEPVSAVCAQSEALPADFLDLIDRLNPTVVKIDGAFQPDFVESTAICAEALRGAGFAMVGTYWRDDNVLAFKGLDRIDWLDTFQPPPWDRLNVIGVRDEVLVKRLVRFGRLYAAQQRQVSELRLARAIRDDYISQLEGVLKAHQKSDVFSLD